MRMTRRVFSLIVFVIMLVSLPSALFSLDFSFLGARIYTMFGFLPVPSGADIRLTFHGSGLFEEIPGAILITAGGGFESESVYRGASGEELDSVSSTSDVDIDRIELYLEPAFRQQLSTKLPLDLYLGTRSYFRHNSRMDDAMFASGSFFPDEDGILCTTLRTGIRFSSRRDDQLHNTPRGIDAGAMFEWAPSFLGNRILGNADFLRLDGTARLFLPLFDAAPNRGRNLFSIYFANQTVFDWLTGNTVPFHEQAKTGGFFETTGMGGIIRGFEKREKPALLKIVNNAEFRFVGPDLGLRSLFPVLSLFFDSGYFAGFTAQGYFAKPLQNDGSVVLSAGATLSVQLFGAAYLGYTVAVPLLGTRADGANIGTALAVGLHF